MLQYPNIPMRGQVDVETTTSFIPWMKDFYYQLDCDVSAFLTNYVNLLVFPFFFH